MTPVKDPHAKQSSRRRSIRPAAYATSVQYPLRSSWGRLAQPSRLQEGAGKRDWGE